MWLYYIYDFKQFSLSSRLSSFWELLGVITDHIPKRKERVNLRINWKVIVGIKGTPTCQLGP